MSFSPRARPHRQRSASHLPRPSCQRTQSGPAVPASSSPVRARSGAPRDWAGYGVHAPRFDTGPLAHAGRWRLPAPPHLDRLRTRREAGGLPWALRAPCAGPTGTFRPLSQHPLASPRTEWREGRRWQFVSGHQCVAVRRRGLQGGGRTRTRRRRLWHPPGPPGGRPTSCRSAGRPVPLTVIVCVRDAKPAKLMEGSVRRSRGGRATGVEGR